MTRRAAKAKKAKPKKATGVPSAPKIKPQVPIELGFKGKYKERHYGGRWYDSDATATKVEQLAKLTVQCQTVHIKVKDLVDIGLLIGRTITVDPPLPKGTGIKPAMFATFSVPYSRGDSPKKIDNTATILFEESKQGKFVKFKMSHGSYEFKLRQETFKELCEFLDKDYKIVEVKSK